MADLIITGPGINSALPSRELRGASELRPLQGVQGGWPSAGEGFDAIFQQAMATGVAPVTGSPVDAISGAMTRGVNAVNGDLEAADSAAQAFVRGDDTSVHDVMLAMTKADTSFRFMTTIGRKVIEAYQDIMRMQV